MKIFVEQKSKEKELIVSEAFVKRIIQFIVTTYLPAKKDYHVGIFLIGQREITKLHKRFFRRSHATDVISLPCEVKSALPVVLLGDIFVCVDTACRQAKEYGHTYKQEIALLVTHGMLHLLGYDDVEPADKKRMQQEEQKILKTLDTDRNS